MKKSIKIKLTLADPNAGQVQLEATEVNVEYSEEKEMKFSFIDKNGIKVIVELEKPL